MALFGSPQQEGAGVSKNGPEVRGFVRFFTLFKRHYGKLLEVGWLTAIFNIIFPLEGLGAVGAARLARLAVRDRHSFMSDYFDCIKENWKKALPMGIINTLLLSLALFAAYYVYNDPKDGLNFIMLAASFAAVLLVCFIRYYTPAILITFNVSLGQLYKDALVLSFAGFGRNMLIFLIHALSFAVICLPMLFNLYVGFGIGVCLYILLIPPLRYFTIQYHIYPVMFKNMIEPFMKENPGEGERTLRELGLIENEEEPLMSDRH